MTGFGDGTTLAPDPGVQATHPSTSGSAGASNPSASRSAGTRVVAVIAAAGVIALGVLIVRELMPRHAAPHASGPSDRTEDTAPIAAPTPTVHASRPLPRPLTTAKTQAAAPAFSIATPTAPLAATVIAGVAADPDAYGPKRVFSPPAGKDELYNFEPLPPFNSTTLRRSRANPGAWELDAMHGPKLTDLGPEGAVHQAAVAKDSIGNETPWYVIDSGPLAPAYALKQANAVRVMSREYLVANRATLPPEVAALLDK